MGDGQRAAAEANEHTPLIKVHSSDSPQWPRSVLYKILLCAFLVSTSFGVTQVPILYVFRVMTCDAYYEHHAPPAPGSMRDRCSVNEIESSTARSISLLGMSTTVFGLINLFITGWSIKKIGVKYALIVQVLWPAMRLAIQNVGVMVGGLNGIIIVQCSQIMTIIGGPNGYLLALNTYITEVVDHEQRTGALGQLAGFMMCGSATGFLVGGFLGEVNILMPFRVTMLLFLFCTIYVVVSLPYIGPDKVQASKRAKSFFAPVKLFAPQNWITRTGKIERQYGSLLLCFGVFLSILATGYLNTLLQLYATAKFGFATQANGILIFIYLMLRGLFLTFAFPRIIKAGRAYMSRNSKLSADAEVVETQPDVTDPGQIEVTDPILNEQDPLLQPISRTTTKDTHVSNHSLTEENTVSPEIEPYRETYDFDLFYCKFSILADAILTFLATFIRNGPEMYFVAAILPLAAGTGSASKGTILQMCAESDRTDALAGISLVENIARLSTTFVFGLIFAGFADIGRTELTFCVNAAVALLGFTVLLGCRFPPEGSQRYVSEEEQRANNE